MKRVERVRSHPIFVQEYTKTALYEENREFCKHDIVHLLDVARIGWQMILEEHLPIPKDIFYATALLHDIGRARQYEEGIPHAQAGLDAAKTILGACGFSTAEVNAMLLAIAHHSTLPQEDDRPLSVILYRADKASRACYFCRSQEACNWEKKNTEILY